MSEFAHGVVIGAIGALVSVATVMWIVFGQATDQEYRCSICGTTASGPNNARWHAMKRHRHGSHSWFEVMDEITNEE